MLERFQSEQAVREQIEQGYDYYIACEGGRALAYFALLIRQHDAQLSKIYVRKNARGRNIGRRMTEYAEARCREENVTELWLTVNRHNSGSIAFYEKMGFIKSRELVQDIGNGFVMDDYVMSKVVASEHF
jgi:ribosomal protein S18 acetylase RimI-like enzyme